LGIASAQKTAPTKKQGGRVIARRLFAEAISPSRVGDRFVAKPAPRDDTYDCFFPNE